MRYALIDTNGTLHMRAANLTAEFRPDCPTRVNLSASGLPISGWVGDSSLITPGIPRNPVGGAFLCCLGAGIQPYAGPVVVTGFRTIPEPDPCDLDEDTADYLPRLYKDVRIALGMDAGALPAMLASTWASEVREAAEVARSGDVPPIRIRKGGVVEVVDAADRDGVQAAISRMFGGVA